MGWRPKVRSSIGVSLSSTDVGGGHSPGATQAAAPSGSSQAQTSPRGM